MLREFASGHAAALATRSVPQWSQARLTFCGGTAGPLPSSPLPSSEAGAPVACRSSRQRETACQCLVH